MCMLNVQCKLTCDVSPLWTVVWNYEYVCAARNKSFNTSVNALFLSTLSVSKESTVPMAACLLAMAP